MASPQYPVSVRAAALVQTGRLQTFAFSVRWSDGGQTFVRRSRDEFRRLHRTLQETFPIEAGLLRRSDRILPTLPDVPPLARGARTGRGLARLRLLEAYAGTLLTAVEHVSRSPALTGFFAPQPLDLEPTLPPGSLVILPVPEEPLPGPVGRLDIRSLEAQSLHCLQPYRTQDTRGRPFHVRAQEPLDVLLRHASGWWLVENEDKQMAWFPAPYLEEVAPGQVQEGDPPRGSSGMHPQCPPAPLELSKPGEEAVGLDGAKGTGAQFCASRAYKGCSADELSVPAGARVRVLETSDRGWWLCRYGSRAGLLPAVLLRPDRLGALLGGAAGREDSAGRARESLPATRPAVPVRPPLSAIQSRCSSVTTHRALGWDPGSQGLA